MQPGSKIPPEGFGWARYQEAGTTAEQVEDWADEYPGANWAVLLGRPSRLVALDVDSPVALHRVEVMGGFRPNGEVPPWFETGRGWQLLYRLPADLLDARGVKPCEEVEIRSNGQYSVVPPSTHPSGKVYEWRNPPTTLEAIPYPPAWMLRLLRGEHLDDTTQQTTPRPASHPTDEGRRRSVSRDNPRPTDELRGVNARLLTMPGFRWLSESVFPIGHRNAAYFALGLVCKASGMSRREVEETLDRWRLGHTRPVYGTYPDRQREPGDVFAVLWRLPYGFKASRVLELRNDHGEAMPESWAVDLERAYPRTRPRGERIHEPLFATVARILVALKDANAFRPTVLTHEQLGKLAGISAHRVAKVGPFLDEIGVRGLTRQGRSTASVYCLTNLKPTPDQLTKQFARWRGYRLSFLVVMKALWRRIRALMVKAFSVANLVWNRVRGVSQGESSPAAGGATEGPQRTGPPPDSRALDALTDGRRADSRAVLGAVLEVV